MLAENFGLDGVLVLVIVPAVLFAASVISKLARNLGSARSELAKGLTESAAATDGSTDVAKAGAKAVVKAAAKDAATDAATAAGGSSTRPSTAGWTLLDLDLRRDGR
jgi:Sec-independent protein translocase protein TatA